jgi:hypothetical protein
VRPKSPTPGRTVCVCLCACAPPALLVCVGLPRRGCTAHEMVTQQSHDSTSAPQPFGTSCSAPSPHKVPHAPSSAQNDPMPHAASTPQATSQAPPVTPLPHEGPMPPPCRAYTRPAASWPVTCGVVDSGNVSGASRSLLPSLASPLLKRMGRVWITGAPASPPTRLSSSSAGPGPGADGPAPPDCP